MRRLIPDPLVELQRADLPAAYADPRRQRSGGRPWLMMNMITSADGASTLDDASGGLGGPADRAVFSVIRSLADVILVGAATVRAEHYGPPSKPGQRVAVVSRSGVLDWDSELFTSGAGIAVLPEDGPDVPASAVVRAGVGSVDLATVLQRLPGDVVLAEGGPSLNGQLAAAGLVEELCLTVAPRIVGGTAGRIVTGPPAAMPMLELAHVLEDDGFLFCRYLRPEPPA
ncbi:MAG TPA: dihydrofolate reductase family protein [Acidimicrobiales bacterium]|nr:dihydrofolate reductase family protein [Acidimicrobiales bacterium]